MSTKTCATCPELIASRRKICPRCLEKAIQKRARPSEPVRKANEKFQKAIAKRNDIKEDAVIPESHPSFIDDSPRFEYSYEQQYMCQPSDAMRSTGRTTAIALQALAEAISARGRHPVYAQDHFEGRAGQTTLMARIENLAKEIGWPSVQLTPQADFTVKIEARYVPDKLHTGFRR